MGCSSMAVSFECDPWPFPAASHTKVNTQDPFRGPNGCKYLRRGSAFDHAPVAGKTSTMFEFNMTVITANHHFSLSIKFRTFWFQNCVHRNC